MRNSAAVYFVKAFAQRGALFMALALSAATAWAVNDKVTVNPASGGSAISADSTGGVWTTLTGPVATESLPGDIGVGTIVLTAPSGFIFNTGAAVTVLVNGSATSANNINGVANNGTFDATVAADGSSVTVTITNASTNSAGKLTWQNIQVRPVAGTPLARGNIVESGSSSLLNLNVLSATWASLVEVAGVPTQLIFVQQPTFTVFGASISPAPVASTADQFGNVSATSTNEIITVAIGNNPTGATLGGTTSGNAKNAPVTLNSLTVSLPGTGYTLVASAPGFGSVTSAVFNVAGATATTTALVVSGSMVVGPTQTLTATISTNTATGTVTFMDGASSLGSVTVNGGQAILSVSLTAGSHSLAAVYNGDAVCAPSTSAAQVISIVTLTAPRLDYACQNGQMQVGWDAQIGVKYQLQSAPDITSGPWTNVGASLTAATNRVSCLDTFETNRFYRVAVLP